MRVSTKAVLCFFAQFTPTAIPWDAAKGRLREDGSQMRQQGESSSGTVLNDEKFIYDVFNNRIAVWLNDTSQLYTVYDGANPQGKRI